MQDYIEKAVLSECKTYLKNQIQILHQRVYSANAGHIRYKVYIYQKLLKYLEELEERRKADDEQAENFEHESV